MTIPPNVKYQDRFLIAYREARVKERVMAGMRISVNLYCDYSNKQGKGLKKTIYFHIVLSRLRYWIASERCSIRTLLLWSRSAIVLLTLSILLYALAEIPSSVMA